MSKHKVNTNTVVSGPVSVIVCAKNEEENLKSALPVILSQDFPDFEVIVVDDNSTDGTWNYIEKLALTYANLKTVKRGDKFEGFAGKKGALLAGVEVAKHEILLLTDADCVPASKNWINRMTCHFDLGTDIVLGYSPYIKEAGFLNGLIRFETFYTALQYFSLALIGRPYMGVGRNLAYRKSVFKTSNAFEIHKNLQSGDDDLLINDIATNSNVQIELRRDSWTTSKAESSLSQYVFQKLRHFSTGRYYKTRFKVLLGLLGASTSIFLLLFLIMLLSSGYWKPALLLFGMRGLLQFIVLKKCSENLGEGDLLLNSSLYDIVLAIFAPLISLIASYINRNKWMI
ncbi:MAG: glycosyltransferase [Flavobacteriales bacterium]|nr:glycosyltransferase [Flavobacteriales bacterium]